MRDTGYRSPEEIEAWRARCPIKRLAARLLSEGTASESELAQIEAEVQSVVEEALAFAERSPWPDPATLTNHVYSV
jgi:TPP-dependent pyruvate/acetoin dehydrogenase alpha subunit